MLVVSFYVEMVMDLTFNIAYSVFIRFWMKFVGFPLGIQTFLAIYDTELPFIMILT